MLHQVEKSFMKKETTNQPGKVVKTMKTCLLEQWQDYLPLA